MGVDGAKRGGSVAGKGARVAAKRAASPSKAKARAKAREQALANATLGGTARIDIDKLKQKNVTLAAVLGNKRLDTVQMLDKLWRYLVQNDLLLT